MSLLQRSLSAGAVIALTALLRAACRGRLPRRMYIALWDLAALRLLVPFSLPWAYSPRALMSAWLSHGQQIAQVQPIAYAGAAGAAGAIGAAGAADAIGATGAIGASEAAQTVMETSAWSAAALPWGTILWLTVMLLLAAHFLRAYVVSLRAFGESLPDGTPQTAAILERFPLRRHVRVRVSDRIGAPLSYGVARPVILLPKGMDRSGDTLTHVLLHELAHIRALDAVRKLALAACLCVHWFNPLVYIMFLLANRDMELLCDARVLARLGRASRRDYAMTLLALEARRSELSPLASGFSMTAIEERITAMKTMKKMSAAAALSAALLVLCAGVALATDVPKEDTRMTRSTAASAGSAGVNFAVSREHYEENFAVYEPYGLALDASGRLMYEGKVVRYFEDMYPVGTEGMAGTVIQFTDGEMDVYAERDLTGPIVRNPDGSFDPSGKLVGLRAATPAEYDMRTQRILKDDGVPKTAVAEASILMEGGAQAATYVSEPSDSVPSVLMEGGAQAATYVSEPSDSVPSILMEGGAQAETYVSEPEVVWWTAEEYERYVETQREEMAQLVAEGARAWTNTKGWFTWTQAEMDEVMAIYEQTLDDIRSGAHVSKTVDGSDDVILYENPGGPALTCVITAEDSVALQVTENSAVFQGTEDGQ